MIGWTGFVAENVILSENRDFLISKLQDDGYHLLYNSCSLFACSSILYGYIFHGRRQGPRMLRNGAIGGSVAGRVFAFAIQAVGFSGLMHSLPKLQVPVSISFNSTGKSNDTLANEEVKFAPKLKMLCPVDFKDSKTERNGVYGLERVTRHPGLWSLGLSCLGTALCTPFWSEFILFGYPILFAGIGGAHQDARFRRTGKLTKEVDAQTSLFPFMALLTGKQKWADLHRELKWVNVWIGVFSAFGLAIRREIKFSRLLCKK